MGELIPFSTLVDDSRYLPDAPCNDLASVRVCLPHCYTQSARRQERGMAFSFEWPLCPYPLLPVAGSVRHDREISRAAPSLGAVFIGVFESAFAIPQFIRSI